MIYLLTGRRAFIFYNSNHKNTHSTKGGIIMSDPKTKITAELDLTQAKRQMKQFLDTRHDTKINVDTSSITKAQQQIRALLNQNISVKAKVDTGSISNAAAAVTKELRQIQNLTNQIGNTKIQISGSDSGGIAGIQGQLRQIEADYQNLSNTLNQKIDPNLNLDSGLNSNSLKGANSAGKDYLENAANIASIGGGLSQFKQSASLNLD